MVLTDKLGIVADCWNSQSNEPDWTRIRNANEKLRKQVRNSKYFSIDEEAWVLDLGCGTKGSEFPRVCQEEFPKTKIILLDNFFGFLKGLNHDAKICADGAKLPFRSESLEMVFAGHLLHEGIIKDSRWRNDEPYQLVKESYRVLEERGLFLFTYGESGDDISTINNLKEIGFKELIHLQRLEFYKGSPTDIYSAIK